MTMANCLQCGAEVPLNKHTKKPRMFCSQICGTRASNARWPQRPDAKENDIWRAMKKRCKNPSHPFYSSYGGRGITVCERWETFANFYADMGPKPEGLTLERIDNDGNYEPSNCKWGTRTEQSRNRRTSWTDEENRILESSLAAGLKYADIARLIGKSREAVSTHASKLGLRSRRGAGGILLDRPNTMTI